MMTSSLVGFPDDFIQHALYAPSAWFLHEVLSVDADANVVRARMDTTRLGALVDAQRTDSGHDLHVPAACFIQSTGVLGNLHAHLVLGLRAADGWFGYGTRITEARFERMGTIGAPVDATCTVTKARKMRGTWFVDYDFVYEQEGQTVYCSKQSAIWLQKTA